MCIHGQKLGKQVDRLSSEEEKLGRGKREVGACGQIQRATVGKKRTSILASDVQVSLGQRGQISDLRLNIRVPLLEVERLVQQANLCVSLRRLNGRVPVPDAPAGSGCRRISYRYGACRA